MTLRSRLLFFLIAMGVCFLLIQSTLFYVAGLSFTLASLLGILGLVPLAYLFSWFTAKPIREIIAMARLNLSGNSESNLPSIPVDELGGLERAIDEMAIQLKSRIEEVATEKDTFQTILSGMVEGVLWVDERGRILLVNEALRNLLSLSSDVSGRTPLEVIRNAELEEALQKVIREGGREILELSLPPMGEKTLEVNVVGLTSSSQTSDQTKGKLGGAIAVFHDITRLKRLEKVRQDFVANVSHELRTPLTTIKGYVETLLDGAIHEDKAVPFLQVVRRHADRLEKILEDLLILAKVETKTFSPKRERVLLGNVIEHAVELVKESAEKKGISIVRDEISSTLFVHGEQGYLEQVFVNLLDNAIKYGRQGGRIRVFVAERDQNEIQISVEDDGIGIPTEDLPRVFERFYRVDKGRSKELGGTGLGLSIVRHIVQTHGGKVWAESQAGKGSTFHFTLSRT
jgi:two-component system phosphate regulon sensor histidine kinase PhoR